MGGEARRARRGDGRGKKRRGAGEGGRKKEGRECMGEGPRGAETRVKAALLPLAFGWFDGLSVERKTPGSRTSTGDQSFTWK